jgi:uncharacterized protein (TIGR02598 family)
MPRVVSGYRAVPLGNRAGFSLVEVAVATAVIAIGLLVVIGLFPQGLQSARNAADNTLSATIAQTTFNLIRTSPFNQVYSCSNCASVPPSPPHDLRSYSGVDIIYFNQQGVEIPSVPASLVSTAAYYLVTVSYSPPPLLTAPWPVSVLQATVFWPAYQSGIPTNTISTINANVFVTYVAWYDSP